MLGNHLFEQFFLFESLPIFFNKFVIFFCTLFCIPYPLKFRHNILYHFTLTSGNHLRIPFHIFCQSILRQIRTSYDKMIFFLFLKDISLGMKATSGTFCLIHAKLHIGETCQCVQCRRITKAQIICRQNTALYPLMFQFLQRLQKRRNTASCNKRYTDREFITMTQFILNCRKHLLSLFIVIVNKLRAIC